MSVSKAHPGLHHLCCRLRDNDEDLCTVDLGGMNIGKNGAIALGNALQRNSNLQVLNVSYNLIPSAGAVVLVKGAYQIQSLDMRYNSIVDTGAESIGEVLSRPDCKLKNLWLRNNYIGVRGVMAMMKPLVKNTSLQQIDLGTNQIGNEGVRFVSEVLQHNHTLKWLGLWNNDIDADGIMSIAEGLAENTTLEVLHLGGNRVGDEGAIALAECLYRNKTLKRLYLANAGVGESGAVALAEALRHNTTVEIVDLLHNPIGIEGVLSFRDTLERSNTTLIALLLDYYDHQGRSSENDSYNHSSISSNNNSSIPSLGLRRINYKKSANAQIAIYLKLNQAGRSNMYNVDLPSSTWSTILAHKVGKEPDLVYLTILEKPDLFRRS